MRTTRDDAVSAILGFLAALAAYAFAFVVFLNYASAPPTESSTVDVDLQNRAATALGVIVTDTASWPADADELSRFSLASGSANFLDLEKIRNLRKASMAESDNGYVDYEEARMSLGLTDHQFHLRTYPALISMDDASWSKMRGIRAAYLADYTEPSSSADLTATASANAGVTDYTLTIRNLDSDPMIFVTSFSFEVDDKTIQTTRQTKLLDQNEVDTLVVRLHPLKAWDQTDLDMDLVTSDNYDACSGCDPKSLTAGTVADGVNAHDYHLLAEVSDSYYVTGEEVTIYVDHFNKDGGKNANEDARLRVYRPLLSDPDLQEATPMLDETNTDLPNGKGAKWRKECACADRAGLWKVVVTPPTEDTRDTVVYYWVAPSELFTATTERDPVAVKEIQYMDDLVEEFDPRLYHPTTESSDESPDGDVYKDEHQKMGDLEDAIDDDPLACDDAAAPNPRYDMLVVGSNVAHNALVKIKDEVADFVACGGTLIVFGSDRAGTEWLQSVYNVALRDGAGGGISTPDPTHPLLNVPEKLSWNGYDDSGYHWDIGPGNDIYSHAVDGGASNELILGVSEQGSLEGTLVLTSWTPGDLTTPQNDDEAKKLLHNLLSQGYQMLFLDYGPPIPDGIPVGSSSRLAAVPYAELAQSPYVEVRIVLYAWRG